MKKIAAIGLTVLFLLTAGCAAHPASEEPKFRVETSFYPLYIMTLNITKGIEGVQVDNMAGQQAGCLHDYQLQTKDMKNIEKANVFVINGAGMESFLDKVTDALPSLTTITASEGISLLGGHEHEHEDEQKEKEEEEGEEANPHVWVSITNYMAQVKNIADGLAEADPENALAYQENAQLYLAKLSELRGRMHESLDGLPNRDIITFHEAFPYFAEEFGLNIVKVVNREPDSQPSAKELAETIRLVRDSNVKAVFAEPQYSASAANILSQESGAAFYTLDPAVTGPDDPDAYLNAMEENRKVLEKALS